MERIIKNFSVSRLVSFFLVGLYLWTIFCEIWRRGGLPPDDQIMFTFSAIALLAMFIYALRTIKDSKNTNRKDQALLPIIALLFFTVSIMVKGVFKLLG